MGFEDIRKDMVFTGAVLVRPSSKSRLQIDIEDLNYPDARVYLGLYFPGWRLELLF